LAIFALTLNLTDSRMGRALQAIHEKELTAQALGIPSHRYKVLVFVISAIYAAVAGFCYAHYVTFISPKSFDIFYSVQIVTMVVVGGMGNLWGGLAGTALLTCLPEVLHRFEDLHVLLYGLILMGVLTYCPRGLLPALLGMRLPRKDKARMQSGWNTAGRTAAGAGEPAPFLFAALTGQPAHQSAHHPAAADSARRLPVLQLDDISLSFGGLQALDRVSMEVLPGEIVALIGPNGAGKTTLLNVVSGLLKPQNGTIHLEGQAIIGLPPYQVSARGVGRTFQTVQMYQRLTVLENVLLGYHVQGRAGIAAAFLHTPAERTEEQRQRQNALALLGSLQMAGKASWTTQQLTLLEQKFLELLRALALSPRLLLLDEPVGGLNPRERDFLKEFISLLRQRGMGIVLVEHDMDFVMRLADRIVVLQHGSRIATGTPEEIRRNPRVITAYLGVRKT
jgi:branched-chain amino acid transport system permease protein